MRRGASFAIVVGLAGCHPLPDGTVAVSPTDYPTLARDDPAATLIDPYGEHGTPAPLFATPRVVADGGGFVPTGVELWDPRGLEALVVDIRIGDYALPSSPGYAVTRPAAGVQRVTVRPVPGGEVTAAARAEALRATPAYDLASDVVIEAARAATDGVRGARQRVTALLAWLSVNLTYVRDADAEVASTVLVHGKGDCSEMALAFVAMARAIGLPARRVVGLAATHEGDTPGLGLHAWAEVAIDDRWVSVDPTWREAIADASHVPIEVGDRDAWQDVVAGIEVAVVEATRDPDATTELDLRALASALPVHLQLRR